MSKITQKLDEMEKKLDEIVEKGNADIPEDVRKEIDAAIEAGDYEEVDR